MQIGFKRFDRDWILPVGGTMGNKSRNLFAHRDAARAAGFKRAEAVVVPWEYLKVVQNPARFVLSTIDKWLPCWQRIYVRSDAPDEDTDRRIPGLYVTESIWHEDRDYAEVLIEKVIGSYDTLQAMRSRKMRNIRDSGMGLLVERCIGKTSADLAGAYTHGNGWAKIMFVNPEKGHEAMISPSLEDCIVINGKVERPHKLPEEKHANLKEGVTRDAFIRLGKSVTEERVAGQLDYLARQLPQHEGKGYEIEFLAWLSDSYVAQITPIVNRQPITVPDLESKFVVKEVVGTDDYTLDGILALPIGDANRLTNFDDRHRNYTVLTPFLAISGWDGSRAREVISLFNARAFLLIKIDHGCHEPLAAHLKQYLRNTGIALSVTLPEGESENLPPYAAYSPTPHRIVADEASGKAVVLLKEPLKPFEPI